MHDVDVAACQHVSMTNIVRYLLLSNLTGHNYDTSSTENPGSAGANDTVDEAYNYDYGGGGMTAEFLLRDDGGGSYEKGHTTGSISHGFVPPSPAVSSSPAWFRFIIPVISAVGIAGNLLNIAVLTRRRLLSTMQRLERSVTHGLTALAVSDLLFCVAVLPQGGFIDDSDDDEDGSGGGDDRTWTTSTSPLTLVYRVYGVAVVNLLLMQSTWLVTMMAACRYLVVVYPLRARQRLTGRATIASIAAVVIASAVATAPHFVANSVSRCWTIDEHSRRHRWRYEIVPTPMHDSVSFYVRWVWPVCSTFLPLAALGAFNVRLVRELNAARRSTSSSARRPNVPPPTAPPTSGSSLNRKRTSSVMVHVVGGGGGLNQADDGLTVTRTTAAGRKVRVSSFIKTL